VFVGAGGAGAGVSGATCAAVGSAAGEATAVRLASVSGGRAARLPTVVANTPMIGAMTITRARPTYVRAVCQSNTC
jgi:hypothetical protein